jgi:hypothetical protein
MELQAQKKGVCARIYFFILTMKRRAQRELIYGKGYKTHSKKKRKTRKVKESCRESVMCVAFA